MKKLFSTLLFLSFLLAGTLALEGKNKPVFQCKAVLAGQKDVFFCGATIPFTLTLQYPAGYRICGWSLYAYEKHWTRRICLCSLEMDRVRQGCAGSTSWRRRIWTQWYWRNPTRCACIWKNWLAFRPAVMKTCWLRDCWQERMWRSS